MLGLGYKKLNKKLYKKMNKKLYMGFIILAVVVLGSIFYWFVLRPNIIPTRCYNETKNIKQPASSDNRQDYYNRCVQRAWLF